MSSIERMTLFGRTYRITLDCGHLIIRTGDVITKLVTHCATDRLRVGFGFALFFNNALWPAARRAFSCA